MKTLKRYLCCECAQILRDAHLVFKQVPDSKGQQPECDWCHRKRYGAAYSIQYARGRK